MAAKKKAKPSVEVENNDADSIMAGVFDDLAAAGIADKLDNDLNWVTGVDFFDMHNGCYDEDNDKIHIGIGTGRVIQFIGASGSGKTTLAIQSAWNLVKDIKGANIILKDFERSLRETRIQALTGKSFAELGYKFKHNNTKLNSEGFKEMIDSIHAVKMDNYERLVRDFTDVSDTTKSCLPPTVVIIDSLPQMVPEKLVLAEGIGSQMTGGQIALANGTIFKQIFSKLGEANIIVFIINHITTKIETGSFTTKAKLNTLKPDENVAGGSAIRYLTDYMIKLEPGTKLTPDKDYGVQGFKSKMTVIKSRGFPAGKQCDCIYDQSRGWNNVLSNAEMMLVAKEGLVTKGSRCELEGYPTTFYKREIEERYETDELFRDCFDEAAENMIRYSVPGFSAEEIVSRLANISEEELEVA